MDFSDLLAKFYLHFAGMTRIAQIVVAEFARRPDCLIHGPWTAPAWALEAAGIVLGRDYPRPIVDHAAARARALEAYRAIRGPRADE